MTKVVAVMGTEGGVSFSSYGFENALGRIGQNTGNALFQFAMWRLIANPKFSVGPGYPVEAIREMANLIVIPAANQVNPAWDLGHWADFLEGCDLPVVCVGLGAQAQVDGDPRLNLKPGTERFIRVVSERTNYIGVRGKFTQSVLAYHGVENTVVTGCPSQTINQNVSGKRIQGYLESFGAIAQPEVAYVLGTLEPDARQTELHLASSVKDLDHSLILQTEARFLKLVHSRSVSDEDKKFMEWSGKIFRPDLSVDEFVKFMLLKGRFFSDARTWIDSMCRFDLTIGMRIHGAVAAIQADRLGICVAFDSRTLELAQTMGYPYIEYQKINKGMPLHEIVEQTVFSAERFDHLRQVNVGKIRDLLKDAGCELK
ncbi:MAG: polysaccharide pyruvyl transferase family protein [Flavimaricola sp.]|nr:polysaccharide pyruvyl transferase family protein [Flavimaricola sp.]